MAKAKAPKVDPKEVTEVVQFIDAQTALDEFRQEHKEVFDQFAQLAERYNATLEAAEQVVRAKQVTCGPFNLYSFSSKYDGEALYNAVGRQKFLEMGGTTSEKTVYKIDPKKYEAAFSQGKIPDDVDATVHTEAPSFHKPKPIGLGE